MNTHAALRERLAELTALLETRRPLWEERPFSTLPTSWAADYPEVVAFLDRLDHAEIGRLEEARALSAADVPPAMLSWWQEIQALVTVPATREAPLEVRDRRLKMYVPGRKWSQILSFAGVARAEVEPAGVERVVDWCAGKGHLGRLLSAATGLPATLIELDGRLAESALELAAKAGCDVRFHHADVTTPVAWEALGSDRGLVGLHACGGLTNAALEQAVRHDVPALVVAPCCYHKAHGEHRGLRPMSRAGRDSGLRLTHSALRLATADEVVAPGRLRRSRRRENAWRLGFDLLLREATGEDRYTPLGTLPKDILALPFAPFCVALAEHLALPVVVPADAEAAERAGWERARRARAWGLVRSLYRRAIELWLVTDRALFLAEAGREVSVEAFCPRDVTPRNLLLRSRSPARAAARASAR